MIIEDDVLIANMLSLAVKQRFRPLDLHVFHEGLPGLKHCLTHKPDLLIVDLGLPDTDGREIVRQLRAESVATHVIVITGQFYRSLPAELLALGVSGYIEKTWLLDESMKTIDRVLAGGIHFSGGADTSIGTRPPIPGVADGADGPSPDILTAREREIARLVAHGYISKEIADRVGLSPRTVEKARTQIMTKLNLRDLPALVRWCVRHQVE